MLPTFNCGPGAQASLASHAHRTVVPGDGKKGRAEMFKDLTMDPPAELPSPHTNILRRSPETPRTFVGGCARRKEEGAEMFKNLTMDPPARAPSLPQNISCVPQDTKRWERRDVRSADQLHGQYGRAEHEYGVGQPQKQKGGVFVRLFLFGSRQRRRLPGGVGPTLVPGTERSRFRFVREVWVAFAPLLGRRVQAAWAPQWAPQWAPLPYAAPLAFGPMGTLL